MSGRLNTTTSTSEASSLERRWLRRVPYRTDPDVPLLVPIQGAVPAVGKRAAKNRVRNLSRLMSELPRPDNGDVDDDQNDYDPDRVLFAGRQPREDSGFDWPRDGKTHRPLILS